jgi:hypothetical protein
MDDEVHAHEVEGMRLDKVARAVAEIRELRVGVARELKPGGDEDGIDFDAAGAGEFEIELGGLVSISGADEDPSATGKHSSRKKPHQARGIIGAAGGQLEGSILAIGPGLECMGHTVFFG